jgi:hypothetical protein
MTSSVKSEIQMLLLSPSLMKPRGWAVSLSRGYSSATLSLAVLRMQ